MLKLNSSFPFSQGTWPLRKLFGPIWNAKSQCYWLAVFEIKWVSNTFMKITCVEIG